MMAARCGRIAVAFGLCVEVALASLGIAQIPTSGASASMVSDTSAIQVMQRTLQQSGGAQAWNGVHSAEMRLTFTPPGQTNAVRLLMLDDWSTTATRYRRGFVGVTKTPHDHNGASTIPVDKGRIVLEFDQARVLADHIPAAAITVILAHPEYVVKQSDPTKCEATNQCIDVFRRLSLNGPYTKEQQWTISQATGLPTQVRLRLPNLLHPNIEIWKTVSYLGYSNINSLLVPTDLAVSMSKGRDQAMHVEALTLGVAFDTAHFDGELSR